MKTKHPLWIACAVCFSLLTVSHTFAQQSQSVLPVNAAQKEPAIPNGITATYSFKLYNAPNNTFGYDLLQNGKPVYHQVVLTALTNEGKRLFASKAQTEKLAAIAIEKVKKEQLPTFSNEELLRILLSK